MKTLTKYLNEKLVIFPSQVDEKLVIFPSQVDEKLVINKDYKNAYTCAPKTFNELRKIIEDRYDKLGAGTKNMPIDFNDIDVRNIDSFYDNNINIGIFGETKFEYIDISDWDVSNVKYMVAMFHKCKQLKSVGDISDWNVSNVKSMSCMFYGCKQLKSVGDLSNWNVSRVRFITGMFQECEQLKSVGDLSKWNVSSVEDMVCTFKDSGITNIPKWYKK